MIPLQSKQGIIRNIDWDFVVLLRLTQQTITKDLNEWAIYSWSEDNEMKEIDKDWERKY
jgi:hypothetical protein